jgi:regulator of sirC expression with transglutaminase-like and TPR domain
LQPRIAATGSRAALVEQYLDEPARDELAAAILVARLLRGGVDVTAVRDQFDALGEVARRNGVCNAVTLVEFVRNAGFRGADDPQSLDCSCIDLVVARRRGIPISLAIVYVTLARRLGLASCGINFPGHFLARLDGVLVDPLQGYCIDADAALRWLAAADLQQLGDAAFATATPDAIALRMLNNVKAIQATRADFVAALDTIDCQLLLTDEHALLQIERADYWYRLGDPAAAVAVLEAVRDELAGTPLQREVDARLQKWVLHSPPVQH